MYDFIKTIISAIQTWTTKKIKESIKNSVADWHIEDENSSAYIKNKPFSSKIEMVEIVPITKVVVDEKLGWFDKYLDTFNVGETYYVTYDNKEYECIAVMHDTGDEPYYVLGNDGLMFGYAENNGLPFCIFTNREIDSMGIYTSKPGDHTVSISYKQEFINKLDSKYLDLPNNIATTDDIQETLNAVNNKMDKNNPIGYGSFSMNRKSNTDIGDFSHAEGYNTIASGYVSHAEGDSTQATFDTTANTVYRYTLPAGHAAHAEGYGTIAVGGASHAEGLATEASGMYSHSEGFVTTASGNYSHAEGDSAKAIGESSHAEGLGSKASGASSHAEGSYTTADGVSQHVQGRYNIANPDYAHIVGNGTSSQRSNAHTLDWDGNAWFAGDVYVGGTSQNTNFKKLIPAPTNAVAGDLLMYNGTEWVKLSKADLIAEISAALRDVTLINFSIFETEYQAEEGMTWGEWVESEYNTGGFYCNNNDEIEFFSDTHDLFYIINRYADGTPSVHKNDLINANENYRYGTSGGGLEL